MKLIVAVDNNWGIGLRNALLVHIPNDMKFFRKTTTGGVIIMGRKTLESFPQSQPLSGRTNIVLTKDENYKVKGAIVVHSVEEALAECEKYEEEVYCIGGESITDSSCPIVRRRLSPRWTTLMRPTASFPISMNPTNG